MKLETLEQTWPGPGPAWQPSCTSHGTLPRPCGPSSVPCRGRVALSAPLLGGRGNPRGCPGFGEPYGSWNWSGVSALCRRLLEEELAPE